MSISTTQSTFLKTSLTTNTIFQLAKDKEMFLSSSACLPQDQSACEGNCSPGHKSVRDSWSLFRQGLARCEATRPERPMFMSVESCTTLDGCGEWVGTLANSWRTAEDVMPVWASGVNNLYANERLWPIAGKNGPVGGHWNDADMLQLGNGGLSFEEQKSHYTLWAVMCSPLLLGTDITNMDDALKTLLLNKEIAALSQDPLGYPGHVEP